MIKKFGLPLLVAVVAGGVGLLGGTLLSDPTTSAEYKSLAKDLEAASSRSGELQRELTSAQAQVEALTSESQDAGGSSNAPAVSEGAALAPRNLKIGLRTRQKECFGSAGCNVTVQIVPRYVGTQDVSTGSWEITYEIRGAEDGPQIETMTLEHGTFSFPEEQSLQTRTSNDKLTAAVTEVYTLD